MRLCVYDSLLLGAPKAYDGDAGTREPPACRLARVMRAAFLVSANSSERTLLGTEATSARRRVTRWLPAAAAPAFVGVAAAFALTSASGGAAPGQATAHRAALSTASRAAALRTGALRTGAIRAAGTKTAGAGPSGSAATRLTSASRLAAKPATAAASRPAAARKYTVRPGDTLSDIARRVYRDDRFWTAIYWANHRHLRYANEIAAGQVLTVPVKPAKAPAAPTVLGNAPAPATAPVTTADAATGTAQAPAQTPVAQSSVSTSGDSSFQACVIERESGGNSQVMNGSGHYGLYQFSASTWAAYGGSPADFGNASVAEQNQVFENAIAAGGQSNWSLYDGC
jgi:LysM repeat protein